VLEELRVENLGVIDALSLLLGPGMTAITGETGAGKTLLVEAIELLVGGRADASMVRSGAADARVEGRFARSDGEETILARVVPSDGRSRAYVNARMAPASLLGDEGAALVDLHGQHAHQSLLSPAVQRAALDRFAGRPALDALAAYQEARSRIASLRDQRWAATAAPAPANSICCASKCVRSTTPPSRVPTRTTRSRRKSWC
jgi:DNA repair protein RecN (Recombination protein N)